MAYTDSPMLPGGLTEIPATIGFLFRMIRQRFALLSGYAVLQILLQLANAMTGFMLIRAMDKTNYAWFTLAFASQSMVNVLADCGLTSSLTTLGGKLSRDLARLSALVALIRIWRFKFMIVAIIVILPVTWWMLHKNGASINTSIVVLTLVGLSGWATIDISVLVTASKLSNMLPTVLVAESVFGIIRLALVAVLFVCGGNVVTALASAFVASVCQKLYLEYKTSRLLGAPKLFDPAWALRIQSQVRHLLPIGVWHCVQGQISTMILTVFATTGRVADIGALSRFGFVFTVIMLPLGHFVLPAIAQCNESIRLRRLILLTVFGYGILQFLIMLLGSISSRYCLSLLGPNYQHLVSEFVWFLAASGIATIGHVFWGIALTRGWVRNGWLEIPLTITFQIAAAPFLNFSSVSAAIGFVAIGSLAHLLVGLILVAIGLSNSFKDVVVANRSDSEFFDA